MLSSALSSFKNDCVCTEIHVVNEQVKEHGVVEICGRRRMENKCMQDFGETNLKKIDNLENLDTGKR